MDYPNAPVLAPLQRHPGVGVNRWGVPNGANPPQSNVNMPNAEPRNVNMPNAPPHGGKRNKRTKRTKCTKRTKRSKRKTRRSKH
jgi:hypothetical protein